MIVRCLRTGLFALLVLFEVTAFAAVPQAWAYAGWWLPNAWRTAPLNQFERLLFFELKVNTRGEVAERNGWPESFGGLRAAARKAGVPLDLTLALFDPAVFEALFSSAEATDRLLRDAVALAVHEDVAGLQIDFEIYTRIRPATLANYQRFMRTLATRLRQQKPVRNLSVFFPIGGETVMYDPATLAQVDQVVLQGYDAHWATGKTAGPVAPLLGSDRVTWEKAVAEAMALGVPKKRLLLGFPLFGYEWEVKGQKMRGTTLGTGVQTSFAPIADGLLPAIQFNAQERVRQFGVTHDPVSGSSYYQFRKPDGKFVEGWFEDWWSLARKTDYLVREQLGGIAFFMLGYDNQELVHYFLQRRNATIRF